MFGRTKSAKDEAAELAENLEHAAEHAAVAIRQAAEEIGEVAEDVTSSRGGRRLLGLVAIGVVAALAIVWRGRS